MEIISAPTLQGTQNLQFHQNPQPQCSRPSAHGLGYANRDSTLRVACRLSSLACRLPRCLAILGSSATRLSTTSLSCHCRLAPASACPSFMSSRGLADSLLPAAASADSLFKYLWCML
eukprot:1136142-Pelagomonas_calceolata.AAC.2